MAPRKRKPEETIQATSKSNRIKRLQILNEKRPEKSKVNVFPIEISKEARKRRYEIRKATKKYTTTKGKRICQSKATTSTNRIERKRSHNNLLECPFCHALVWEKESNEKTKDGKQMFSICCQKGRVSLPAIKEPPETLAELLESASFKETIKVNNSMLAFTSIGAEVDRSVMSGYGPYTYRIQGQVYHRLGSLLPPEGKAPKFGQLYIFDTGKEVQNRINTMLKEDGSSNLDAKKVEDLICMLDENNWLAAEFRKARDKYESGNTEEFTIRLVGFSDRGRQYDLPTVDETAGLIVGEFGARDIIVQYKTSSNKVKNLFITPLSHPKRKPVSNNYWVRDWSVMAKNATVDVRLAIEEVRQSNLCLLGRKPSGEIALVIKENSKCAELKPTRSLLVLPESSTRASVLVIQQTTVKRHWNSSGLALAGTDKDSK